MISIYIYTQYVYIYDFPIKTSMDFPATWLISRDHQHSWPFFRPFFAQLLAPPPSRKRSWQWCVGPQEIQWLWRGTKAPYGAPGWATWKHVIRKSMENVSLIFHRGEINDWIVIHWQGWPCGSIQECSIFLFHFILCWSIEIPIMDNPHNIYIYK